MGKTRIAVVEDDPSLRGVITGYLKKQGYDVVCAGDGNTGLELATSGVSLVILDIEMPGLDGIQLLGRLRPLSDVPVLVVSARREPIDRVMGLEVGADDYLTKPFVAQELGARVQALLRRSELPAYSSTTRKKGLAVDVEARRVLLDGEVIDLTPKEFDLLKTLAGARGKNFTREELLDRVWGEEYLGESRRVDLCVSKIRAKLKQRGKTELIRSVWGVGYRLE